MTIWINLSVLGFHVKTNPFINERGVVAMDVIQAYYNGSVFVPLAPVKVRLNQPALITIIETADAKTDGSSYAAFFGALSAESYSEITEALKDTERVDANEW